MTERSRAVDLRRVAEAIRETESYIHESRAWGRRGQPAVCAAAARRGGASQAPPPPPRWVDPWSAYSECEVSPAEYDAALAAARKDLLKGKKPVPAGTAPHLLITIGAPGAGKSTVSEAVAADREPGGDYVTIDLDVAVKYHPRYRDIWTAPSVVTGKPTGVSYTLRNAVCNNALMGILARIADDLMLGEGARYNIILQSHAHTSIILAKSAGYRVTLLFVGVPLKVATARARLRAVATGKFLSANLAAQDEVVESMWADYRATAAWYGLWADEFLVADNRRPAKSDGDARAAVLKHVKEIPLHCGDWDACRRNAQDAIDAACAP